MISDILSEYEFKVQLLRWLLKNDRGFLLPEYETVEDYAEIYKLPDFDYVHTQSHPDENDDLVTMMKAEIHLRDWETRNGREPRTFKFYLVLKTLTDCPEVERFPMGYIIVD